MRSCKLTDNQQNAIFSFLGACELTELKLDRRVYTALVVMLGYTIAPNGARIHADISMQIPYGSVKTTTWEDTFYDDWQALVDTQVEADSGASVPPEGD